MLQKHKTFKEKSLSLIRITSDISGLRKGVQRYTVELGTVQDYYHFSICLKCPRNAI